jgi:D-alanine-D-alanine ligase
VLNNKAIGIIELVPLKNRFYDYQSKYTDGFVKHIMPAPLDKAVEVELLYQAELAHKAVGAKTISRVDFLYNSQDGVNILEINTHPGMTPLSLVPEICAHYDITFNEILERLIKDALA